MLPVIMEIIVISLVILTVVQFLLIMFHLTLMTKLIKSMEEVPVPASPPVIDPSMARTARRSDRLQQPYIPRYLTRASAKSKT